MAKKPAKPRVPRKPLGRVAAVVGWLIVALVPGIVAALQLFDRLAGLATRHSLDGQAMVAIVGGSLIAAALVLLWKRFLGRRVQRLVHRFGGVAARRPVVLHVGALVAAVAMAAAGGYLLLPPSTKHVLRSWLWGPQVDLAVRQSASGPPIVRADAFVANLPWFCYGCDFGREEWGRGVSRRAGDVEAALRAVREKGINRVAWFLLADGRGAPRFDRDGMPLPLDAAFWSDYDAALDVARKLDIGILWVLLDQQWFFPGRRETDGSDNPVGLAGRAAVVNEKGRRDAFIRDVLTPLVSRYPNERQILGWVLINEPDNAIRKGYLSAAAFASFVEEAAALIREHSSGQPVSVAFNDVESLVGAGVEAPDVLRNLDFLVFHHYPENFPPPAEHVRALIGEPAGANAKPIYIGEFDAQRPPEDGAFEFSRWTATLGYDSAWPWSVNTLAPVASGYSTISTANTERQGIGLTAIAAAMRALELPERLTEFPRRRELAAAALATGLERWAPWMRDGQTVIRTYDKYDSAKAEERKAALRLEDGNLVKVIQDKEVELAEPGGPVARCFVVNESDLKKHKANVTEETTFATQAAESLKQTQGTIRMLPKGAPELTSLLEQEKKETQWLAEFTDKIKKAELEVARATTALDSCNQFKRQSEQTKTAAETRRSQIHEALAEMDRQRWRSMAYLDFWRPELEWATRVGLFVKE
jgi:hypothetical protein